MSVTVNGREDLVIPAVRVLRTAIDVGDGGAPSQRRLLDLMASSVWHLPDLDLEKLPTITPAEAAALFDDEGAAWRMRQMLVLFEVLRHPQTQAQVERVDEFAIALGGDDEGLRLVRSMVRDETDQAVAHFHHLWNRGMDMLSEQDLLLRYAEIETAVDDPDLAQELRAMRDLPRGTLGREYIEFYLANQFDIPGEGVARPAFFVQHDMSHLVAGLGPTGPGEVALGAFQIGMRDTEAHWLQFLANLAAYELGVFGDETFEAKEAVFEREGAMELVIESFVRGTHCSGNYNDVSLLSFADRPIAEIREQFGVPAPRTPFPDFVD